MKNTFDVDIDVNRNCEKSKYGTRAFVYNETTGKISAHPSGIYREPVPVDNETGLAAFDYKYGEASGYMKVDLLTNNSYNMFNSKEEVIHAMNTTPEWNRLLDEDFVKKLPHISKHFDIVEAVKPESIQELADILALIRPGKRHLLDSYIDSRTSTRRNLYRKPVKEDANYFKKAHAISYAVMIIVVMNKLIEKEGIMW